MLNISKKEVKEMENWAASTSDDENWQRIQVVFLLYMLAKARGHSEAEISRHFAPNIMAAIQPILNDFRENYSNN